MSPVGHVAEPHASAQPPTDASAIAPRRPRSGAGTLHSGIPPYRARPLDRRSIRRRSDLDVRHRHTTLGLAAKRRLPTASLLGLLVAAQGSELAWIGLTYAGVEHPAVDSSGVLHLEHLPYSHSLLTGLGGGVVIWAILRFLAGRPQLATVFRLVFASHIVLDVIQHEPNIRLVPWLAHPALGLNLAGVPLLDFAVETALSVACWAYFRGSKKLLAAIVALNVTNLPLMFAGEGSASGLAGNRFILPTVILLQVVMAWSVTWLFARRTAADIAAAAPAPVPAGPRPAMAR